MQQLLYPVLVSILILILICLSVFTFALIRYLISILFHLADIENWRKNLVPGTKVLVIDHGAHNRLVIAVYDDMVQVQNADGNPSGHHISTIYPITRK